MISFARLPSDSFLLVWNVASVVTFLLPLMAFSIARLTSDQDGNENQGDDQNENYYNNNYQNPDNYDEYGNYVGPTHWWEFWKSNNNGQNDGQEENDNDERGAPWWCKYLKVKTSF